MYKLFCILFLGKVRIGKARRKKQLKSGVGNWPIEEIPIFARPQKIRGQRKVVYLVRVERVVETSEYCWKSAAHIQTQTKDGNEITSFSQENTAALDRIIAAE